MKRPVSPLRLLVLIVGGVLVGWLLLAWFADSFISRAKSAARRANCTSNLKQIGLGIAQYYEDNGKMPRLDSVQHLAADIAPYIGYSPKLFHCPSDTTIGSATDISNVTESSYALVTNAVWQREPMTPMLFDKFHPHGLTVLTGKNAWSLQSAHKDSGNVLWNDGHVDWNRWSLDVGANRYPVVND